MMKKILFLMSFMVLPMLSQAQFLEDFEGGETIPAGWSVIDGGDASNTWDVIDLSASELTAHSGTNIAYIIYGSTPHDDYLISPQVTVTAGVSDFLIFWARSRDPLYPESISVKLSTSGNSASDFTVTLDANVAPASGPDFYKYQYDLTDYVGETIYIGFHSTTNDMFAFDLDDVQVTFIPSCLEPANPVVDAVTTTTADLSWTSDVGDFEVEYGAPGFSIGSGTSAPAIIGAVSTTLTGLTPNTPYEYYVRKDCGNSDYSVWVGPIAFNTPCEANTAFPVEEGFESGVLPVCWSNETVVGSTVWTFVSQNGNGTITPRTGNTMAEFRTSTTGAKTKLVSQPLDLSSATNPELEFYYANVNWVGDIDELRVFYKTDASQPWVQIGTDYLAEQTQWTNVTLTLPNPSATYYVAFEGTSNWARGLNVDDVTIRLAPLSVEDFSITELSYYPNPVKNTFYISHSSQITSVEVYDLLGKKVLENNNHQGTSIQLDMSGVATGSYIAKIYSGNNFQTIKIQKQ
ncbi:hypothetical protein DI383_05915 [Flavobacteriaceae bacterium LYZ1037]|nr:hypothetical protein DI383_05915 [Flavobacteriaceae bacterium LYZ1037]